MSRTYEYKGAAPAGGGSPPYHVMLATPVGVAPCAAYANALAGTVETLSRFGVQFTINLLQGHCHVDDARNLLLRDFLASDCTDLFFIDADLSWQPESVLRLLKAPGDVVAGVYPHKSDDGTYPFHPGPTGRIGPNEHGLYEMMKVATGFMRIRRNAIEALYKYEKGRNRLGRVNDELARDRPEGIRVARIVERGFPSELGLEKEAGNDSYHSGDYVLSLKIRHLGFKLFIDHDMEFGHYGEKQWKGHFGNDMRKRQKIWQTRFVEAVAALMDGNDSIEVFHQLAAHYGVSAWPLPGEQLHELYQRAKTATGEVLETGSGLSTLVLTLALKGTRRKLHSLEHDVYYWRETVRMLEDFRIGPQNVLLHFAPLEPTGDNECRYAIETLPATIGLALLDGPQRYFGRLGVVKALYPAIREAQLIIDDAASEDMLVEWLRENGHDVEIRTGQRWWGIGTPKQQMAEAAE